MSKGAFGRNFSVYADASLNGIPVECFSIEKQKHNLSLSSGDNLLDLTKSTLVDAQQWLPFFAEQYNISAKMNDYLVVPVIIMPSDLPNRNGVGFPYQELVKANVEAGQLSYQTWRGKPTYIDHVNRDHTKAKGIILASAFRPMQRSRGNLWKVILLTAFDRSRDPVLANQILTGERNAYSMGAWTGHFTCSFCQAHHGAKAGCEHISLAQPRMSIRKDTADKNQLVFLQGRDVIGFELSSVKQPAYLSAVTNEIMTWES